MSELKRINCNPITKVYSGQWHCAKGYAKPTVLNHISHIVKLAWLKG